MELNRDKLVVKDGWLHCPFCKNRTNQIVQPNTDAHNLPIWCKKCKATVFVNIENGQCFLISQSR